MRFTEISFAIPCAVVLLTAAASDVLGQQQQQPRPKAAPAAPVGAPARPQPATNQPPANQPPANQPNTNRQPGNAPANPPAAAKQQRPATADLVIQQVPPELEELLQNWEKKSSQIKTLTGKHTRKVYNLVFEVEKRATGTFLLETPDKGRIDLIGYVPKKDEKSERKNATTDESFGMAEELSEKWICNGENLFAVNEKEKTYELVEIPPENRGKNIVNSPLPFLFGMKSDDMKRRFRIHLDQKYKRTDEVAKLIVYPRQQIDQQNYSEAWIMLDKNTYLPTAVKLFDPTSNVETVYIFTDVKINAPEQVGWRQKIFGGAEKDPFNPDFKAEGYKKVLNQVAVNDPRQIQQIQQIQIQQIQVKTTTQIQQPAGTNARPRPPAQGQGQGQGQSNSTTPPTPSRTNVAPAMRNP